MLETTYTYTARNVENPNRMVTITLSDDHMRVDPTGVLEKVERIIDAEDNQEEIREQIESQLSPGMMKMVERLTGPVHVGDVHADLDQSRLRLSMWNRVLGLRLAPVQMDLGQVDNPDAAQAFVEELEERQSEVEEPGKFSGPLDYWLGWIGMALGMVLLFRWPRLRKKS